jgi:hypothetical protein
LSNLYSGKNSFNLKNTLNSILLVPLFFQLPNQEIFH